MFRHPHYDASFVYIASLLQLPISACTLIKGSLTIKVHDFAAGCREYPSGDSCPDETFVQDTDTKGRRRRPVPVHPTGAAVEFCLWATSLQETSDDFISRITYLIRSSLFPLPLETCNSIN